MHHVCRTQRTHRSLYHESKTIETDRRGNGCRGICPFRPSKKDLWVESTNHGEWRKSGAPGVEALLALCTGPRDLYDLFRPMGIFFTGKNKIDADRDIVTVLSGGRAKMRISSLDNTMCREGECAPFSLWLVYQQKYADVVESANRHLDNYPDIDLVITNKPQQNFIETFMNNTGNASYSTRNDPTEVTPFIFLQVAIVNLASYPTLNDETDVHVTLAEHDRPFVVFPSRVKTV